MKCQHDEKWLAYTNPVDVNSDQFCVFCELERLRAQVAALTDECNLLSRNAFPIEMQRTPDAWKDEK